MKENIIMRFLKKVSSMFRTTGAFIMNNSGKLFLLVVVAGALTFVGFKVRSTPKQAELTTKSSTTVQSLGDSHLDSAMDANKDGDYQTAYDEASTYLAGTTTIAGSIEAYLARGEAQIYLKKCKEAMSDLYMAAEVAPNDTKLQARIADKLDILFHGKECADTFIK